MQQRLTVKKYHGIVLSWHQTVDVIVLTGSPDSIVCAQALVSKKL